MNTDKIQGRLKQLKGEIKKRWGQITDDDLTEHEGNLDKLIGRIQERSGESRENIRRWLHEQGLS
jgi:uncharacterized protein YjbJ (UPF0337 family)